MSDEVTKWCSSKGKQKILDKCTLIQFKSDLCTASTHRGVNLAVEVESTVGEKTEVCDLSCIVELSVEFSCTTSTYE